jgi:hypothetical protein
MNVQREIYIGKFMPFKKEGIEYDHSYLPILPLL